jgi:hypothetical protein
MDQLDVIRGFRRRLEAPRPQAKERARRALQEHMVATPQPGRPLPRRPFPRQAASVAVVATVLAGAVAAALLVQGLRDGASPAQPASIARSAPSESVSDSQPVAGSYRDYLQFASRMTRLEIRTGAERGNLAAGASLCAKEELAQIERVAIETLTAAGLPRGRPVLGGRAAVELAAEPHVSGACRYAGFGIERARAVYRGLLPASNLMPEAQSALPGLGAIGKPLL